MSRNRHSKNRRNQSSAQRTTAGQQTRGGGRRKGGKQETTSSGAIPSSMSDGLAPSSTSPASAESQNGRSRVMSLATNALESIKSHPMQYALAGAGIACAGAGITWLLVSAGKHALDEQGNPVALPNRLQASVRDLQTSVKGAGRSISRATGSAGARASRLAHDAVESSKRIEQSVEDVVREHPIAVGAALLATGAAIALAMPRSVLEDTWLGRERDQVVSSAQKLAQGAMQKAESLAKQMSSRTSNGTAQA